MSEEHQSHETDDAGVGHPTPPYIECGRCGEKHHYDAAIGEYQGRCSECSAFLRRPTEEEHEQFTEFLRWNTERMEGSA